ncbi:hypothetical protein E2562_003231 [Oryza meyeriana var. granulata]|uniref:Dirigent protein n=1 Tax=Oryza meyeriana var. granulata TaxID=110450 RepID=A0A6G1EUS5_9ORYZ|nr:hypothetical protein E2562_003231 [Oryza meyeriana var. granulata]
MAPSRNASTSFPPFLALLVVLLVVVSTQAAAGAGSEGGGETMTQLHFYFHERFAAGGAENATIAMVAPGRADGTGGATFGFGFVGVMDDALREGLETSSGLVGRAQGLAATASLGGGELLTAFNLVFTCRSYNGSTLAVLGRAPLAVMGRDLGDQVMERAVVGGTGAFRMARGYTLSRPVKSPEPESLFVLEFDVYVWHQEVADHAGK